MGGEEAKRNKRSNRACEIISAGRFRAVEAGPPLALSIMRLREQIGLCNKSSLGTQLGWIKLTSRSPNPFALLHPALVPISSA